MFTLCVRSSIYDLFVKLDHFIPSTFPLHSVLYFKRPFHGCHLHVDLTTFIRVKFHLVRQGMSTEPTGPGAESSEWLRHLDSLLLETPVLTQMLQPINSFKQHSKLNMSRLLSLRIRVINCILEKSPHTSPVCFITLTKIIKM